MGFRFLYILKGFMMMRRVLSPFRMGFWIISLVCLALLLERSAWINQGFTWLHNHLSFSSSAYACEHEGHEAPHHHKADTNTPKPKPVKDIITNLKKEQNRTLAFSLLRQDRTPVTQIDYAGKHLLVFFGFTNCPVVCPTTLATMGRVMEKLSPEAKEHIQPLFITLDPERDTIERLKDYTRMFHPAIQGLTGTLSQVDTAAKSLQVYYLRQKKDENDLSYSVDHTPFMYVTNEKAEVIAVIQDTADVNGIAAYLEGITQ
jgi:cytochrome oxidase Cu insertion factor (SCO1/SenC/PrrC family)